MIERVARNISAYHFMALKLHRQPLFSILYLKIRPMFEKGDLGGAHCSNRADFGLIRKSTKFDSGNDPLPCGGKKPNP